MFSNSARHFPFEDEFKSVINYVDMCFPFLRVCVFVCLIASLFLLPAS